MAVVRLPYQIPDTLAARVQNKFYLEEGDIPPHRHLAQRGTGNTRSLGLRFFNSSPAKRTEGRYPWNISAASCPTDIDWQELGAVTPPQDQGDCNAAWAFTAVGALEAAHYIATGNLIPLSVKQLIDCDASNKGCKGGNIENAFDWLTRYYGLRSVDGYVRSYQGEEGLCPGSPGRAAASLLDYQCTPNDEDDLLLALCNMPVAAYIHATENFADYRGGLFDDSTCSSLEGDLNHAIFLTGYGTTEDGEPFYIAKNMAPSAEEAGPATTQSRWTNIDLDQLEHDPSDHATCRDSSRRAPTRTEAIKRSFGAPDSSDMLEEFRLLRNCRSLSTSHRQPLPTLCSIDPTTGEVQKSVSISPMPLSMGLKRAGLGRDAHAYRPSHIPAPSNMAGEAPLRKNAQHGEDTSRLSTTNAPLTTVREAPLKQYRADVDTYRLSTQSAPSNIVEDTPLKQYAQRGESISEPHVKLKLSTPAGGGPCPEEIYLAFDECLIIGTSSEESGSLGRIGISPDPTLGSFGLGSDFDEEPRNLMRTSASTRAMISMTAGAKTSAGGAAYVRGHSNSTTYDTCNAGAKTIAGGAASVRGHSNSTTYDTCNAGAKTSAGGAASVRGHSNSTTYDTCNAGAKTSAGGAAYVRGHSNSTTYDTCNAGPKTSAGSAAYVREHTNSTTYDTWNSGPKTSAGGAAYVREHTTSTTHLVRDPTHGEAPHIHSASLREDQGLISKRKSMDRTHSPAYNTHVLRDPNHNEAPPNHFTPLISLRRSMDRTHSTAYDTHVLRDPTHNEAPPIHFAPLISLRRSIDRTHSIAYDTCTAVAWAVRDQTHTTAYNPYIVRGPTNAAASPFPSAPVITMPRSMDCSPTMAHSPASSFHSPAIERLHLVPDANIHQPGWRTGTDMAMANSAAEPDADIQQPGWRTGAAMSSLTVPQGGEKRLFKVSTKCTAAAVVSVVHADMAMANSAAQYRLEQKSGQGGLSKRAQPMTPNEGSIKGGLSKGAQPTQPLCTADFCKVGLNAQHAPSRRSSQFPPHSPATYTDNRVRRHSCSDALLGSTHKCWAGSTRFTPFSTTSSLPMKNSPLKAGAVTMSVGGAATKGGVVGANPSKDGMALLKTSLSGSNPLKDGVVSMKVSMASKMSSAAPRTSWGEENSSAHGGMLYEVVVPACSTSLNLPCFTCDTVAIRLALAMVLAAFLFLGVF
eukprot:gene24589-10203_t